MPSRKQARQRLLGPALSSVGVIMMAVVALVTSGGSAPGKLALVAALLAGLALTLGGHYLGLTGGAVKQLSPLRLRGVARLATAADLPVRATITGFVVLLLANFAIIVGCFYRLFSD